MMLNWLLLGGMTVCSVGAFGTAFWVTWRRQSTVRKWVGKR